MRYIKALGHPSKIQTFPWFWRWEIQPVELILQKETVIGDEGIKESLYLMAGCSNACSLQGAPFMPEDNCSELMCNFCN